MTGTLWFECTGITHEADEVVAAFHIPKGSPWCDGHFPGNPVIPGIAILDMLSSVLKQVGLHRNVVLSLVELRTVRFMKKLAPPADLELHLQGDPLSGGPELRFAVYETHGLKDLVSRGAVCCRRAQGRDNA